MNKEILYKYLKEISGLDNIKDDYYISKNLKLSSKEVIDLAIFINERFNAKINFSEDMPVKAIFEIIANKGK